MNQLKKNRKAQSALEFTILMGFSLILVSGMFVIIQNNITTMEDKREEVIINQMFNLITSEIEFAQLSKPIYYRTFYLPPNLGGQQYNISLYDNRDLVIKYMNHEKVVFLRENTTISGNFEVPGINKIVKECENCTLILNDGELNRRQQDEFITIWNTNIFGDNKPITLPLVEEGEYDFTVDWGDGTQSRITSYNSQDKTHHYEIPGEYTVTISGQIEGWSFKEEPESRNLITSITKWGPLKLGNTGGYFTRTTHLLEINTPDILNLEETYDLSYMFQGCEMLSTITNLSQWDTSHVTDMSHMFEQAYEFNEPVAYWNTSKVTDMSFMFAQASKFNQHIGQQWDIQNIKTMEAIFSGTNINSYNYDLIIEQLYFQALNHEITNIEFGAEGLEYCNMWEERESLIHNYEWTISGDNLQYSSCRPPKDDGDKEFQR